MCFLQITQVHPKSKLKRQLMVKFTGEAGIDQGGVKKEFFQILTKRMFDPEFGERVTCSLLAADGSADGPWTHNCRHVHAGRGRSYAVVQRQLV